MVESDRINNISVIKPLQVNKNLHCNQSIIQTLETPKRMQLYMNHMVSSEEIKCWAIAKLMTKITLFSFSQEWASVRPFD